MEDHKSLPVLDGQLQVDTSFVLDNCYAAEGDAVIMAGSLVEGMGNRYSDLDVYVFCESPKLSSAVNLDGHYRVISNARKIVRDRDGDCEVMLVHTVLPQSGVKVDVEFKTYRELAQLQVRVDEIFAYARQNLVLLSQRLSFREESLMHRLFTGTVLLGAQKLEDFRSGFSKAKYCYLAYRWSASDFSVLLDLMGSWAQGDIDAAADRARENLLLQMQGVLHLTGVTNRNRKWLLHYLRRSALADDVKDRFVRLMFFRGVAGIDQLRDYVVACLDLGDELFGLSNALLDALGVVPAGEAAIRMLDADRARLPGEEVYAQAEYSYRKKPYGFRGRPTREYLGPLGRDSP